MRQLEAYRYNLLSSLQYKYRGDRSPISPERYSRQTSFRDIITGLIERWKNRPHITFDHSALNSFRAELGEKTYWEIFEDILLQI
jgi:hypothetical protein